ncbi:putative transmembrane protein [Halotydeus destructor]|nr:putative transmembrane protein [Halotydeus destructor]
MALRVYLGHGEAAKRKSVMPKPIKMADSEECLMLPVADNNANCKAIAQQSTSDGRHASCQHSESCAKYSLTGFALPLAATWAGHVVMSCLKRYRRVYADPSVILDIVQSKSSLKFGLFFGTFSAIYKASSCLLRRYSDGNRDWHGLLGGALAGPSMLIYPNTTITLYLFWKCVETLYWNAINSGHLGYPQLTATIVYALSVSQIAYCVLLAPKHMRPSYMRFIDQITGGRFQLVNRFGLYILAPDAIKGYEDYFPDLDPKLMSNKFMESCFVWLI